MKKLSAYQKLKAENLKLIQDIHVLTQLDGSKEPGAIIKYFEVKLKWDMAFKLEKLIWGA